VNRPEVFPRGRSNRSDHDFTERSHSYPGTEETEPIPSPAPNPSAPDAQTHPSEWLRPPAPRRNRETTISPNEPILAPNPNKPNQFPRPPRTQSHPSLKLPILQPRRGRPEQQQLYRTNPFLPRAQTNRTTFLTRAEPNLALRSNSHPPEWLPIRNPARPPGAATILPNEPILAQEPKETKPLSSPASNPISPFAQTPHPPEWLPSSSPAETVGGFFGLLGENHFPHPRRTQSRLSLKPPSARVAPQPPAPPRPPGAATILPNEPILAREPKKTKPLSSPASNPISPLAQTPHPPEWLPSSSPAETARSSNDFTERTHSRRETEETKPLSSHAPNPISPFAQTPHPPRVAPHPPAPPRPPGAATILPNEPILAREPEETKPLSSPVSNPISTPSLKPIHPGGPPSATAPAKPAKTTNRRTNPFPARARRSRPPRDLRTQSRIHSPK
jgi:hypothetical protein